MGTVCYRLWEQYVTAYGNGMLPLMEMVCYRLWKWYVTVLSTHCLHAVYTLSTLCLHLVYTLFTPFMEV